ARPDPAGDRGAGRVRLAGHAERAGAGGLAGAPSPSTIWTRCRIRHRRTTFVRLLSRFATEHFHRKTYAGNDQRRVTPGEIGCPTVTHAIIRPPFRRRADRGSATIVAWLPRRLDRNAF